MAWFPGAVRKPVARHRTPMARYRGICEHVAVSEAASLFSYFNQVGNPTSHFYVLRDGTCEQYVDTAFRAPAQLDGNSSMISVETQGGVKDADREPWTVEQIETLAQIAAWAHKVHGIPLVAMPDSRPTSSGIGYHRLGIDPWRVDGGELWSKARGKICPGSAKIAQIPTIIKRAKVLAAGGEDMATLELIEHKIDQLAEVLGLRYEVDANRYVAYAQWNAADVARDQADAERDAAEMGVLGQIAAAVDAVAADVKALRGEQS